VATDKRARQRANRAKKIESEIKNERKSKVRQLVVTGLLIVIGMAALMAILNLTGGDDSDPVDATGDSGDHSETSTSTTLTSTTLTSTTIEGPTSAVSAPAPGATLEGTPECPEEDGSSERVTQFGEAPPMCIDPGATYTATVETTLGTIEFDLSTADAPETVNNFVFLARYHYYEGAPFHRIIPDFVIQGGDAVGDPPGIGNPGYQIDEEPPETGYEIGSVAMAKAREAGSTGSQFFIVTGEQGARLPTEYSLLGKVTSGMDVVAKIEAIPTTDVDAPTEEIYITSVTITKS